MATKYYKKVENDKRSETSKQNIKKAQNEKRKRVIKGRNLGEKYRDLIMGIAMHPENIEKLKELAKTNPAVFYSRIVPFVLPRDLYVTVDVGDRLKQIVDAQKRAALPETKVIEMPKTDISKQVDDKDKKEDELP